eukprot:2377701-Pyramimonas_sp.AAC.1
MIARSVKTVTLTNAADLNTLASAMRFDDDFGGFATFPRMPSLGLDGGFRLIESGHIADTHAIPQLAIPPEGLELTLFNNMNGVGLALMSTFPSERVFNEFAPLGRDAHLRPWRVAIRGGSNSLHAVQTQL